MGVFNTAIKVKRAVEDPRTDHKLPHPASLSWEGVTGESALGGTSGHHCELVHGDHWRQIAGNVMENIQQDATTNITGNHSHTVAGNQNTSIIGDAQALHVGTCTKTHVDSKIELYGKHRFTYMPGNTEYTYQDTAFQSYMFKFQVCCWQLQINGMTFNFITSPAAALLATLPATVIAVTEPATKDTVVDSSGNKVTVAEAPPSSLNQDSRGSVAGGFGASLAVGAALGAAGGEAAMALSTPISITGNIGLNMSSDVLNLSTTALLKVTGVTCEGKLHGIEGRLGAAFAHAGAALAKALPRVGFPPHTPTCGG